MPYIGKQPTVGNFQVCDAISVVNGQAAYTMQVGSANVEPERAFHMLVSLNGVLQKPGSSFTISGSTITFASNLATGDVIDFITLLGDTLNTGAPSDDTVTAAKLNNDIISGQTALTSAPDDTDEFLVSDAGVLKRIDYSYIKDSGATHIKLITTTVSGSSVSSIDFDSTYITSTYTNYMLVFNLFPVVDNGTPLVRFSTSGTFATGSSDYGHAFYGDGGTDENDNSRSSIEMGGGVGNATGEVASGHALIMGIATDTMFTTMVHNTSNKTTSSLHGYRVGGGSRNTRAANDGIRIFFDNGNINVGSKVTLYGITQ